MSKLTDIFEFTVSNEVWIATDSQFDDDGGSPQMFLRNQEFFYGETDEEKADFMADSIIENGESSVEGDASYRIYEHFQHICQRAGIEYP